MWEFNSETSASIAPFRGGCETREEAFRGVEKFSRLRRYYTDSKDFILQVGCLTTSDKLRNFISTKYTYVLAPIAYR